MANFNERSNDSVEFKLISRIGTLACYQTGWNKEINIVSWNGGVAKYDIRDWNPEHDRMTRGVTLHEEEARKLAEILAERFIVNGTGSAGRNVNGGSDREVDNTNSPGELYEVSCDEDGVIISGESA